MPTPGGGTVPGRSRRRDRRRLAAGLAVTLVLTTLVAGGLLPGRGGPSAPAATGPASVAPALSAVGAAAAPRAFPVGAEPSAPASIPPNVTVSGSRVWNESQSFYVDDLTIEGSGEFIFGNSSWTATLTVYGNIYVSGHGRLLLWDCYVDLVGSYTGDRSVFLNGSARATLNEAFVSSGGVGWDGEMYGTSNLTILASSLAAHSVLQFHDNSSLYADDSKVDADLQPSGNASLVQVDCADSALWFPFYGGNTGTFSFPVPNQETTWSFPPRGSTGIAYRVRLGADWPALIATILYPGSNITVENTLDLDASFLPINGSLQAEGLRFGMNSNYTLATGQFRLHLENVSIDSWSFYPVNSSVTLSDSQLGEVNGWSGSTMDLVDSNLTDLGGYYAAFENSTLSITGCTIGSTVLGYDTSRTWIANSTVLPDETVLAVGNASIEATNVSLGAGAAYAAQQSGLVTVREPLVVAASEDGGPALGATVAVVGNGTLPLALNGTTNASGLVTFDPTVELVAAAGNLSASSVLLTATEGDQAAENATTLAGPVRWDAALVPLVAASAPANGSVDVAASSGISLNFAFPMNRTATVAALELSPDVALAGLGWSIDDRELELQPLENWSAGTNVSLTIGTGARTVEGLALPEPYRLGFTIAPLVRPPPVLEVVGSEPSNGSTNVGLDATIAVAFSVPMDPAATIAAFTCVPALPEGGLAVNGSLLVWTGAAPLRPGTTYRVTLAANATAVDGAALGGAWSFAFATVPSSEVPVLVAAEPRNGSLLTGSPANVTLTFSVPMDPTTTAAAFAIAPSVPGTVVVAGTNLTFTPNGTFPAGTTYTVEVGLGARSALGVPLLRPVAVHFVLAAPQAPGTPNGTTATAASTGGPGLSATDVLALGALGATLAFLGGLAVAQLRRRPPDGAEGLS